MVEGYFKLLPHSFLQVRLLRFNEIDSMVFEKLTISKDRGTVVYIYSIFFFFSEINDLVFLHYYLLFENLSVTEVVCRLLSFFRLYNFSTTRISMICTSRCRTCFVSCICVLSPLNDLQSE